MTTEQIEAHRPAFEAWYFGQFGYLAQFNPRIEQYVGDFTQCRWQGWIAAKADPAPPRGTEAGKPGTIASSRHAETANGEA